MCRLECPSTYSEDYRALLAKHRHIFSMNKNEIGFCNTFLHKLFMKTDEPVYVKQFKIPEAHHHYLQDQVKEWLRLGIIQPSRSRYNSPVFLVSRRSGEPAPPSLPLWTSPLGSGRWLSIPGPGLTRPSLFRAWVSLNGKSYRWVWPRLPQPFNDWWNKW